MSQTTAGRASQSSFGRVSAPTPQRSVIPISSTRKTTLDAGLLIPIYHQFCLPGDVWNLNIAMFARLLTLKFPLMDSLILDWFAFYTPERLVWKNFEKQQGYQENPGDTTDYVFPWLNGNDSSAFTQVQHDLGDYFGLPNGTIDSMTYKIRSGPFRAYRLQYDAWFRNENYQDSVYASGDSADPIGDGPDDYTVVSRVLRRNKRPDYFSGALPAPQKGPDIPLPWNNDGLAPVIGDGTETIFTNIATGLDYSLRQASATVPAHWSSTSATASNMMLSEIDSHVFADIGSITANMNELRESIVLQQIYELDMRGGTRYTEALKMRWDVDAEDYRLQRPEYIGGGSSNFSVSQVAQTSPTAGDNAQASLAAYSELRTVGHVNYRCVEHGHLMILVNVRAPLVYQQNLNRKWLASSRFDLPEPLTMNLGERAVMGYELFFPPSDPEAVWGYQPIWSEYRYDPSFVSGKFRSNVADSLDEWHLALAYSVPPVHDGEWMQDNPEIERVVAFTDQPQFKFDFLAKGVVARKMPVDSIPGLMRF